MAVGCAYAGVDGDLRVAAGRHQWLVDQGTSGTLKVWWVLDHGT